MTTRHLLAGAGHGLRAAVPPLLAFSVLALARTRQGEAPTPAGVGELFLVGWRVAIIGTLLWFLVIVVRAATRPWRDRRAFQRLQHVRESATVPNRALVHVQTIVWSSAAGQDTVVVNIATGVTSHVWLTEAAVPIGSFVVLERAGSGVRLVGMVQPNHVESAHRYERRHPAKRLTSVSMGYDSPDMGYDSPDQDECDDARALVEETEQFLKEQRYRG